MVPGLSSYEGPVLQTFPDPSSTLPGVLWLPKVLSPQECIKGICLSSSM